jgi:dsDNA-binding SOS-regulon protein
MEWKWTKGEPYERSRRLKHVTELESQESQEFSKETEKDAYTSALNHDENTWDILNQSCSGSGFKVSNKREELDTKIADRHLVQQRGFNPFLGENNYVNDVTIRDQFLKPQNTTTDRVSSNIDK